MKSPRRRLAPSQKTPSLNRDGGHIAALAVPLYLAELRRLLPAAAASHPRSPVGSGQPRGVLCGTREPSVHSPGHVQGRRSTTHTVPYVSAAWSQPGLRMPSPCNGGVRRRLPGPEPAGTRTCEANFALRPFRARRCGAPPPGVRGAPGAHMPRSVDPAAGLPAFQRETPGRVRLRSGCRLAPPGDSLETSSAPTSPVHRLCHVYSLAVVSYYTIRSPLAQHPFGHRVRARSVSCSRFRSHFALVAAASGSNLATSRASAAGFPRPGGFPCV